LAVGGIVGLIGTVFSLQKLITDMWHDVGHHFYTRFNNLESTRRISCVFLVGCSCFCWRRFIERCAVL
jgi:hypothetical protein